MQRATTKLVRTASRSVAARRQFSSEPKMHKAGALWADLKAKRPIDHDDQHVRTTNGRENENSLRNSKFPLTFFTRTQLVFHPPYNRVTIVGILFGVVSIGMGSMYYGE